MKPAERKEQKIKLDCDTSVINSQMLKGNIENFIGWTQIPTGMAGPLFINGEYAKGSYHIPLATTEGALVASYARGCKAITEAGGANCLITKEGLQRSPLFQFNSLNEVKLFTSWIEKNSALFQFITSTKSKYCILLNIKTLVEGNNVSVIFEFYTDNAAGQNMVTICTDAICEVIKMDAPVKPNHWYVEGNFSGDKKATHHSMSHVRGKRVSAEVEISDYVLKHILKSNAKNMAEYWVNSSLACIQSGSVGIQGHYANGLTALYLATGQDVACIAEASLGITRMKDLGNGNLYASVTLPGLVVGSVGGGTWLPTQKECLQMLGCQGADSSKKLAEIAAALCLAGELSIAAALAEGHFTNAHKSLGRKKN